MTIPFWTVDDASLLRLKDNARRAAWNDRYGRRIQGLVKAAFGSAGKLVGDRAYRPSLQRASLRMNANRITAFDSYAPKPNDVICSAYFKAGTNWIMHVCYQIANLGKGQFAHIQNEIAWPDAAQPRYWRALSDDNAAMSPTGYRVIKSHLSADLIPVASPAKVIAMTRDPVDCAASGYHFFAKLIFGPMTPPPDVWLDFFGSEDAFWGSWHAFTSSWWNERDRTNVQFLRFEDMKADPQGTIKKIARFLDVELTESQVSLVLDVTSFDTMKAQNDKFYPVRQSIWSAPKGQIIRKGAIGDGDTLFSREAIAKYRRKMTEGLMQAGSDFPHYGLLDDAA